MSTAVTAWSRPVPIDGRARARASRGRITSIAPARLGEIPRSSMSAAHSDGAIRNAAPARTSACRCRHVTMSMSREGRVLPQAARTFRSVRHAATEAPVGARQRHRRAGEPQIVDRDAVRDVEAGSAASAPSRVRTDDARARARCRTWRRWHRRRTLPRSRSAGSRSRRCASGRRHRATPPASDRPPR